MRHSFIVFAMFQAISVGITTGDGGVGISKSAIDFDTQIMPLLTRHGCNAGSCHGAAIGRGGFKLSLLGSNAEADHNVVTRAMEGRRVNLWNVDRSLLLLKPSEQTGHEGGLVLEESSAGYTLLRDWIAQGAHRDPSRRLTSLDVTPDDALMDRTGDSIPYTVTAAFVDLASNETVKEDVADWTVLTSADSEAVSIDTQSRRLTIHRPGLHVVIARFMDQVLPMRLMVPMQNEHSSRAPTASSTDAKSIDKFVDAQLDRLRIPVSPIADDYTFLRRVTLDLRGRIPTIDELEAFIADASMQKRSKVIDAQLRSRDFADYWALKWANILMIDAKQLQAKGADTFHRWLADQFHLDRPLDEMFGEMLTAVGDSYVIGPANFSRFGQNPGELAEHVSQTLMGTRLRCANCHNHPLDHWTQDDYHGMSAIFAKLKRGRVVSISDRGEVTHPVTRSPAAARIPGIRFLEPDEDGREVLKEWLVSDDNPYLARTAVNRIWRELMGRGIVEPVDDMRATNPPTHPELLDWLANDFVENGFQMKTLIAKICRSDAYQRASKPVHGNASDKVFYSHATVRPLEAQVVADAIGDVTKSPLRIGDSDETRVVSLTNNLAESRSLDLLGRCDRAIGCEASGDSRNSLTRALHLINGPLLQQRINLPQGTLAKTLASTHDDARVLDHLFLLTLARPNTSRSNSWKNELSRADLSTPESRREFFEDVLWGILASDVFATNH